MKLIMTGLMLLIVTGCGKSSLPEFSVPSKDENTVIVLAAKSGIFTGSANFGVFAHDSKSSKLITFNLKNQGTEPLTGPATIDNTNGNYLVSYSNCPTTLSVGKSCSIKVTFDAKVAQAGTHIANLNFDSVFVEMSAIKENPPVVTENPVIFLISSSPTASVNFGTISEKQTVLKTITIKNTSSSPINSVVTIPQGFNTSYDGCSNKALSKNSTCQIKVSLSGAGKSGLIAGDLVYASKGLSLSGEVLSSNSGGNQTLFPVINFLNGVTILPEPSEYDFGSLIASENKQFILNIKNSGTFNSIQSTASLNNTNFSIVYNQCINKVLTVNTSCQVRLLFSAVGKNPSEYTSTLSFAGKSLILKAKVEQLVVDGGAEKITYNVTNANSQQSFENIAEYLTNGNSFSMPTGAVVNFRVNFNESVTFDAIRFKENYINVSIKKSDNSIIFSQAASLNDNTAIFPLQTIAAGDYITISLQQALNASGSDFQITQFKNNKAFISDATKNGVSQAFGPLVLIRRVIQAAYFSIYQCDGSFEGLTIRPDLISAADIEASGFANNQTIDGYTSSITFGAMSVSRNINWDAPWEEIEQEMLMYPNIDLIPSNLSLNQIASYMPTTVPAGYDCFNFSVQLKQLTPFSFNKYSLWVEEPAPIASSLEFSSNLKSSDLILSNGNKTLTGSAAPVISWGYISNYITTAANGKYYIELKFTNPYYSYIGGNFLNSDPSIFYNGSWPFALTAGYTGFYAHQGEGILFQNSGGVGTTSSLNWTNQSVVMLALDLQNNKVWQGVNGVWSNGDPSLNSGGLDISLSRSSFSRFYFAVGISSGSVEVLNTNQYAPPTGFISP